MQVCKLLSFFVCFSVAELQLNHNIALLLPVAWCYRYEVSGYLNNLLVVLVLDAKAIHLVEERLDKLVGKVASNNLLTGLAH